MAQGNYRIIVSFDPDKRVFRARAPELEQCTAEGPSRAEAVSRLEEEMQAQLANIAQHGGHVPSAVDDVEEGKLGDVAVRLSKSTHRELLWAARQEGVPVDQLAAEILSAAVESYRARGPSRPRAQQGAGGGQRDDDFGNRTDGRPQRGHGARYHGIMDDSANFLEYVRGLEAGGGARPAGRPPGGGGGGGGPGGGGGGAGRRRRGRGRGPGGGPPGPGNGGGGSNGGGGGGASGGE